MIKKKKKITEKMKVEQYENKNWFNINRNYNNSNKTKITLIHTIYIFY